MKVWISSKGSGGGSGGPSGSPSGGQRPALLPHAPGLALVPRQPKKRRRDHLHLAHHPTLRLIALHRLLLRALEPCELLDPEPGSGPPVPVPALSAVPGVGCGTAWSLTAARAPAATASASGMGCSAAFLFLSFGLSTGAGSAAWRRYRLDTMAAVRPVPSAVAFAAQSRAPCCATSVISLPCSSSLHFLVTVTTRGARLRQYPAGLSGIAPWTVLYLALNIQSQHQWTAA